jgi:hypothetical protein
MAIIADKVSTTKAPEEKERWNTIYQTLAEPMVDEIVIFKLSGMCSLMRVLEKQPSAGGFDHDVENTRLIPRAEPIRKQMLKAVESRWLHRFYKQLFHINTPYTLLFRIKLSCKIAADIPIFVEGEERKPRHTKQEKCTLDDLWVPALQLLVPLLKDHINEGAVGDPSNGLQIRPPHQHMFITVLDAHLDVCVGVIPINAPTLVLRAMPPCCADCTAVNTFLTNGSERGFQIGVNKQCRAYIHHRLDSNKVDCHHRSERDTIPRTLVITEDVQQLPTSAPGLGPTQDGRREGSGEIGGGRSKGDSGL